MKTAYFLSDDVQIEQKIPFEGGVRLAITLWACKWKLKQKIAYLHAVCVDGVLYR